MFTGKERKPYLFHGHVIGATLDIYIFLFPHPRAQIVRERSKEGSDVTFCILFAGWMGILDWEGELIVSKPIEVLSETT